MTTQIPHHGPRRAMLVWLTIPALLLCVVFPPLFLAAPIALVLWIARRASHKRYEAQLRDNEAVRGQRGRGY